MVIVLDVHIRGKKIKYFLSKYYNNASSTKMVHGEIHVLVCI